MEVEPRLPYEIYGIIVLEPQINNDLERVARAIRALSIIFAIITAGVVLVLIVGLAYIYCYDTNSAKYD